MGVWVVSAGLHLSPITIASKRVWLIVLFAFRLWAAIVRLCHTPPLYTSWLLEQVVCCSRWLLRGALSCGLYRFVGFGCLRFVAVDGCIGSVV